MAQKMVFLTGSSKIAGVTLGARMATSESIEEMEPAESISPLRLRLFTSEHRRFTSIGPILYHLYL
ncbi:hypothetical protein AHF37_12840 [Paragonimus kellicotti]|nr:hypothetical protein AHF37_12840 [Paragonimus kellicotti]